MRTANQRQYSQMARNARAAQTEREQQTPQEKTQAEQRQGGK